MEKSDKNQHLIKSGILRTYLEEDEEAVSSDAESETESVSGSVFAEPPFLSKASSPVRAGSRRSSRAEKSSLKIVINSIN